VTNNITVNQHSIAVPQQPIINPQPIVLETPAQPVSPVQAERPVSPVSNPSITVLQPPVGAKKTSIAYYIMLIILIGLCILTLSIYQSRMDKSATPNLAKPSDVSENAPAPKVEEAFIAPEPVPAPVAVAEPAVPMPTPVVEPEPAPQPEPVVVAEPEPMPEPAPVIAEPAPQPEPVAALPIAEPEPAAPAPEQKPILIESQPEPAVIAVPVEKPTITLPLKPEYPVHGPVNYDDDQSNSVSSQLCTSGMAPDEDGCCAGENLKFVESLNGYACCSVADGECYPPLK